MEKEELLHAWTDLQVRVEKCTNLLFTSQARVYTQEMSRLQGKLRRSPITDIVISALVVITIANFLAQNFNDALESPIAALPGFALFVTAGCFMNLAIRQLILTSEINYGTPIVEAQTKLAMLRKLRIRSNQLAFLVGIPAWLLIPMVFVQGFAGLDVIFKFNSAWLIGNVVFGLAMIPIVNWVITKSRFSTSIQDDFAGKEIAEVETLLAELKAFQSE